MDKKCSKYEGLFVFTDELTLQNHIAECEECRKEHEKMEKVFGTPADTYRTEYTYISDLSWENIGQKITECGMEKHVTVTQARMEEILDIKYKEQPKITEETLQTVEAEEKIEVEEKVEGKIE